jgi:phenylalanyl-tRNA synthetase beta chain
MKISLNWLRDYIDTSGYTAQQIADTLSDRGLPIESIESSGDDTVIDVEITSNRGDCLGHIGIARELSAAWTRPLILPQIENLSESERNAGQLVDVKIEEPILCGRYVARVIEGVKIGPSPDWVVKRLEAVGLRSVNNVVDATNYAMMEHGQPPHAFDYDKIQGQKIIIRKARAGEQIVSIDGTKCELNDSMLVIADARRPVALAGVMGGLETEVSNQTTKILLEEASFNPVCVRRTSRRLALPSEASYRFERLVDIEQIDWASRRCAQLIMQFAGGKSARGAVDAYPGKAEKITAGMRFSRLKTLLGIEIPKDKIMTIFKALGFEPELKNDDLVVCMVPGWRHDIYREADLIEEAARCWGYDKIPVERKISIEAAPRDKRQALADRVRSVLSGYGFFETISVSFVEPEMAAVFGNVDCERHLAVQDINQKSTRILRSNLMGSLVGVLRSNYRAGNMPCRVYELADTYMPAQQPDRKLPVERACLGLATDGDFRELRAAVEGVIEIANPAMTVEFKPASIAWALAGAEIYMNGVSIGTAGVMKADLAKRFDLDRAAQICVGQLDFDSLFESLGPTVVVKPIPRFPAVRRDLSLILEEKIPWVQIMEVINAARPQELEKIEFVALYRGKPIPAGQKSVTVSLCFRDDDGTLRHEHVDEFEKTIFTSLQTKLGAQIRTA